MVTSSFLPLSLSLSFCCILLSVPCLNTVLKFDRRSRRRKLCTEKDQKYFRRLASRKSCLGPFTANYKTRLLIFGIESYMASVVLLLMNSLSLRLLRTGVLIVCSAIVRMQYENKVFLCQFVNVWKKLPNESVAARTLATFKKQLKLFDLHSKTDLMHSTISPCSD